MIGKRATKAIVAAAACGFTIPAVAETVDSNLQTEIAALKAEIAQLKQAQGENWLNERRAEEVKTLIREVLADADTRASLLQDGVLAGHDGKFFLRSADGSFLMNVWGQLQFRYILNYQEDRADEWENGFQMRRTKIGFEGHIGSPRIGYEVVIAADRDGGDVAVEDAVLSYDITDNLEIKGGRFKLPFARQELISSKRQLAVDRASVHEYFTLNRAEQIQLVYSQEMFRLYGAFSDGANSGFDDFSDDTDAELALTGRVDVKLAGDWKQMSDLVAWDDDTALFVGGAVHWQSTDEDQAPMVDGDVLFYTVDALFKTGRLAVLGAFYGAEADDELAALDVDGDPGADFPAEDAYGILLEGGYSVTEQLQPFLRWEWIDADGQEDETQLATAGVNYYLRGHAAKFTADVVWKYAGDAPVDLFGANNGAFSSSLGMRSSGVSDDDDQIAIRTQFQLLF